MKSWPEVEYLSALQTWSELESKIIMAESGGEEEGQNLLAVVVDINPNQVTSAMTNGNCMQNIGYTLIAKRKLNYFTLAVVVRAEAQLYESTTQLRTLPDQLTSYA